MQKEEAGRRSILCFVYKCRQSDGCGSVLIEKSDLVGIYNNMKNYSEISLFLLIICVFGDEEDGVKRESVNEGDSVTLDTRLREKFNHIKWRFGDSGSIIAESDRYEPSYRKDERFRDRLKLNHQTGSLTINNMRITDTGVYEIEISHGTGTSTVTFIVTVHVFGADGDGVKRVSVMEGDSVTLGPRLREKFNLIQWRLGDSESIIAEIDGNKISYTDDERFRDRLKLNDQTGSLTINNMRITDSGVYHLEINYNTGTSNQKFNVTVYGSSVTELSHGPVVAIAFVVLLVLSGVLYYYYKISKRRRQNDEEKTESAKEGESVALKTDTEKQTDEEKLELDHQSRSLKNTDSGDSDL
ncbi:uncharacterized protein LOC125273065 isoform X2 [Megalobrama amblycephala]|uniref:uncharacterized protein LOC125273065 isoform X2 n=1 Tax=Megalobrama amblycephala TaxID=75352 RepID=UPI0020142C93|nr:uncharacterized protein LOC125273065 isoform X2 [Megalobrama amblycephala]